MPKIVGENSLVFQKWEATGNDFFFVQSDSYNYSQDWWRDWARSVCRRESGGGADGLVLYSKLDSGRFQMTIFNSDGSLGDMCGNALRCLAKILKQETGEAEHRVQLRTRPVEVGSQEGHRATVNMGPAAAVEGQTFLATPDSLNSLLPAPGYLLSFGNPHFVCPQDEIPVNWKDLGASVQNAAHALFAQNGVNCGFLKKEPESDGVFTLCVYERGVGPTLSCGSGACAASAVLHEVFEISPPHQLKLPGGILEIGRQGEGFTLTGEAKMEYQGSWELKDGL